MTLNSIKINYLEINNNKSMQITNNIDIKTLIKLDGEGNKVNSAFF